ncbi:MAG: DegV family protein [Chloroflexota bacterium]
MAVCMQSEVQEQSIQTSSYYELVPQSSVTPTVQQRVVIVVDASCELAPEGIREAGVAIIPRVVGTRQQTFALDADQTLHHACASHIPHSIVYQSSTISDIAQLYEEILASGMSIVSLHPPAALDDTVQSAHMASKVVLAGTKHLTTTAPRIAVCELAAVGLRFSFLVQAAAYAAREGLSLPQLVTFIESLQKEIQSYYVTGMHGPVKPMRHSWRPKGVARWGREQLWEYDIPSKQLICSARGKITQTLFQEDGVLDETISPTVCVHHIKLFDRMNAARTKLALPTIISQPTGVSLSRCFPRGCVELHVFPEVTHLNHMLRVIHHIDQTTDLTIRGVRARGGIA